MQIGGTLVNAVVRIVILAATLALVYFFIIKPVLHTTEKGIDSASNFSNDISNSFNIQNEKSYRDAMKQMNDALNQANKATGRVQIQSGQTNLNVKQQQRLLRCVQNANGNTTIMLRCSRRFGP